MENLDMKEMIYTQTQKDVAETKIHHLLSENLFMPKNRPRRMSYSRHAVNEADLGIQGGDVSYKMHMQVRRMVSEGRNLRRRKRTQELAAYDELNEFDGLDKNGNLPKGIRVTGESKQLKDDVVHQAIEDAANLPPDYDDSENNNFISTRVRGQRSSSPAQGLQLNVPRMRSKSPSHSGQEKNPVPWLSKYGEMNPAYESDDDDDSFDYGKR